MIFHGRKRLLTCAKIPSISANPYNRFRVKYCDISTIVIGVLMKRSLEIFDYSALASIMADKYCLGVSNVLDSIQTVSVNLKLTPIKVRVCSVATSSMSLAAS